MSTTRIYNKVAAVFILTLHVQNHIYLLALLSKFKTLLEHYCKSYITTLKEQTSVKFDLSQPLPSQQGGNCVY